MLEARNRAATAAAPSRDQQGGALVGTIKLSDGHHQPFERFRRDEPWKPRWRLWQIARTEDRASRRIRPAPRRGVVKHHRKRAQPRQLRSDANAGSRQAGGVGEHSLTCELGEAVQLRVVDAQPVGQMPSCIADFRQRVRPGVQGLTGASVALDEIVECRFYPQPSRFGRTALRRLVDEMLMVKCRLQGKQSSHQR
jgi:hypothetical protein